MLVTSQEKKKEYLKAKVDELETNRKIGIIRDLFGGINDLINCYQPRTIVNDEKGDWFANFHSILFRWRNHFSQLLNIHGVNLLKTKRMCYI
jgi:hypothetical protein